MATLKSGTPNGGANQFGGKVAFIDADYFTGLWDANIGNTGDRTAAHEFGHLVNLEHTSLKGNVMRNNTGNSFFITAASTTNSQLRAIHYSYQQGRLNQGSNIEMTPYYQYSKGQWGYRKMPNRGIVAPAIKY